MSSSFLIGGELMKKLFEIKPVKNKKRKKKYPYKIVFADGHKVPVPSQYDFDDSSFIRRHGCIIAAFFMGLRVAGEKKSMKSCLKYLQEHFSKGIHINYNLQQVCTATNELAPGSPAVFYSKISKAEMKKALKAGHMVLYTEKDPIHTSVLLWSGKKFIRFSDGKYKSVTVAWEIRKRCGDGWYGGCVVVRKGGKEKS